MNSRAMLYFPFFAFSLCTCIFGQEFNYENGNGTIIQSKITSDGGKIIDRKHNQKITVGEVYDSLSLEVYKDPLSLNDDAIKHLNPGDRITISKLESQYGSSGALERTLAFITTEGGTSGWIYLSNKDFYENGKWSVTEKIKTGKTTLIFRKLEQYLALYEATNVVKKPGDDTVDVAFTLAPSKANPQIEVFVIEICEEPSIVKGYYDYWVKIKDDTGRTGWIFAASATVERGGPKYLTPKNEIEHLLNF